jgi:small subunit ribosomal protein S9
MANKLSKKKTVVQKVVKKKIEVVADHKVGKIMMAAPTGDHHAAIGRRKTAVARVRVYTKAGDSIVNGLPALEYFNTIPMADKIWGEPAQLVGLTGQYMFSAKVTGSGLHSQLEAVRHGLARAFLKINASHRGLMKEAGMLTRDDRMKETRKIGKGGKARRSKQSPKR